MLANSKDTNMEIENEKPSVDRSSDVTISSEEINSFMSVPSSDTLIKDTPGVSLTRSKGSTSSESLRYPSSGDVAGDADGHAASDAAGHTNKLFRRAHQRGYETRKANENNSIRDLETEFNNYVCDLENKYFKGDENNQQTIVTKISEGISKNASGLQHRAYVHVKPTWRDFANWDRYRPVLPNCNEFTDTHPEKCLLRFLDMMKEAGYFGTDDEKFKISWQLVNDDKTSSSGVKTKKIRFSWVDLSTVSPSGSLERDLGSVQK